MTHSTLVKPRLFLTLSLLIVLIASCAPVATPEASAQTIPDTVVLPSATLAPTLEQVISPTQIVELPTETLAPTPFPVATSRGPNLEATDPSTVSLASGGLQLVEFFEFW